MIPRSLSRSVAVSLVLALASACGGTPWDGGIDDRRGSGGERTGGGGGGAVNDGSGGASAGSAGNDGSAGTSSGGDTGTATGTGGTGTSGGGKHVFVSRTSYTGDLGGAAGADAKCQTSAAAAGLGGTWQAWISTSSASAPSRVVGNGPWRLVGSEELVFASAAALRGYPAHAIDRDEYGSSPQSTGVWTGTLNQGVASDDTCADWTTGTWTAHGVTGFPYSTDSWTSDVSLDCDGTNALLCIEE